MGVNPVFEVPWERKGIIAPGLPILPPGIERHPVPGGGSRAVALSQGDMISVLDREGLQLGEMVFFAPDFRSDAGMLGAKGTGRPEATIATLANGSPSGKRVLKALATAKFDIGAGDAIRLFEEGSCPGDMEDFTALCDGLLILVAPGGPMVHDAQDTPTELILYVRRAKPSVGKPDIGPPDPLADPILDFNIKPGQATGYEVKAGQYIQVLDVKGRECSDFQEFSLRALDKGS